jgi:hypothetical protein
MHAVTRPVHFPFATHDSAAPMPAIVPQQSSLAVSQVWVPHDILPDEPPDEDPEEEPDDDPDEEPDEDPEEPPELEAPAWPPSGSGSSSFGSSRRVRPPQPIRSTKAAAEIEGRMYGSPR